MRRGILPGLRKQRRWLAHAVAVFLVLPALIGLLPQAALSATAALERDAMASICGQDRPQPVDHDGQQHAGHDHCVVCATACAGLGPGLAAVSPAFATRPGRTGVLGALQAGETGSPLQASVAWRPPRGPPAASPA